jgi:tryprostatin B 6-hydroxylase
MYAQVSGSRPYFPPSHYLYKYIGPNEISVIDPDVVDAVLGSASKCTKPPWYDINPLHSILTVRDEKEHRVIRKAYEHGLRESSLRHYESEIVDSLTEFISLLKIRGREAIDVSYWTKLFVVDINDQVSFSKKPDSLKTGKMPTGIEKLQESFFFLGMLGPVPWLFILMLDIPFIRNEFNRGADFCRSLVADRLKVRLSCVLLGICG